MKKTICLLACLASGIANSATLDVIYTSTSSGNADANAILAAQGGTTTEVNSTMFNALTALDLGAYDLLVIGWYGSTSYNFNWDAVLLPYINAGGGVIFEAPANIGDLSGSGFSISEVNTSNDLSSYDGIFGDGLFSNTHMAITSLSSDWECHLNNSSGQCNLATGEFGSGRAIIGGYDSFYHERGTTDYIVNEANWVTSGFASSPTSVPEPTFLAMLGLGLGVVGLSRKKYSKVRIFA